MKAGATALAIAALAIVFPSGGQAANMAGNAAPKGAIKAKIQYCTECHGPSGRGYRAYYPIPQLAGQQVQYLENQFTALAGHNRDNPVAKRFMVPIAERLTPGMRTAIAEYFSAQKPRPAGGGPKNLVAQGKQIFDEGLPNENVPACAACHGSNGEGSDLVPRVAGQMYAYTVEQLNGWGKGYRSKDPVSPENPNTMQAIATSMTKEQIAAVAAYLARLDL